MCHHILSILVLAAFATTGLTCKSKDDISSQVRFFRGLAEDGAYPTICDLVPDNGIAASQTHVLTANSGGPETLTVHINQAKGGGRHPVIFSLASNERRFSYSIRCDDKLHLLYSTKADWIALKKFYLGDSSEERPGAAGSSGELMEIGQIVCDMTFKDCMHVFLLSADGKRTFGVLFNDEKIGEGKYRAGVLEPNTLIHPHVLQSDTFAFSRETSKGSFRNR